MLELGGGKKREERVCAKSDDSRVMERVDVQEIAEHDVSLASQPQRDAHTLWIHLVVEALQGRGGRG